MAEERILLIDDDPTIRFSIGDFLQTHRYQVEEAENLKAGRHKFQTMHPHAVLLDYELPDGNALDLLPELISEDSQVSVIVLTGHGSIELAVRAIKEGADQFITKPVQLQALLTMIQRGIEARRNKRKDLVLKSKRERFNVDSFMGTSPAIAKLKSQAERLVGAESPILILGETGVGKGELAKWLHRNGPRHEEAFVDLNCAGLSREFLETELFGHEKGAFTGAAARKLGLLEVAHRGTVFLDEIGDVDPQVQPKLLKVLEDKRFRRLGDVKDQQVDIRLIAATHQNLEKKVKDQTFRGDLFYRISTLPLVVPPLRDRVEDIPVLAEHLVERLQGQLGRGPMSILPESRRHLQRYSWPGNIRELRNVLERGMLLCNGRELRPEDLAFGPGTGEAHPPAKPEIDHSHLTLDEMEKLHIQRALEQEGFHVARAAKRLDVPRSSLYQKIKKFDLVIGRE